MLCIRLLDDAAHRTITGNCEVSLENDPTEGWIGWKQSVLVHEGANASAEGAELKISQRH